MINHTYISIQCAKAWAEILVFLKSRSRWPEIAYCTTCAGEIAIPGHGREVSHLP
jgi:hypothetical protein